jgi:aspartyl-tRNA(Asn)/glutamyl-tRNA(Gln) amidotransferase subunit C
MSITPQQIRKIAKLARIGMDEGDIEHFTKEVSGILDWAEQLQEVDTTDVPRMTSVADVTLPLREDVVIGGNRQEDILANAPKSNYGCFMVPKVVE